MKMSSNSTMFPCVAKPRDMKDYLNMPTQVFRFGKWVSIAEVNSLRSKDAAFASAVRGKENKL